MGDQRGAGIVDEGIDLLGFLTAGFDLEKTKAYSDSSISVFTGAMPASVFLY